MISAWRYIVVVSLSVFAVLYLFQPFGIHRIDPDRKMFVLLGYMAVTAAVMSLQSYLFPRLLPRFYDEQRWTVGRNILNMVVLLVLITAGNIIYGHVFNITWQHFDISVFVSALLITVITGIFPILLVTVLRQNRLLKVSLREARQINDSLPAGGGASLYPQNSRPLTLSGRGKDSLVISAGQLLYLEACGNYVKVNYLKNDVLTKKMLRTTIKQTEDATAEYPFIVKCHRAFLVNLNAVEQVNGNSQGYRLILTGCDDEIPVARAFTHIIKRRIEHPPV
jgi:hypothetical protein